MQLREIQVDGFGVFANARIRGLTSGLNILYGRNEFGKTTVLEFIRRVLFGFPTKASPLNQYPALQGGKYGGRLVCRMRDSSLPELTVARTLGKGGGLLTISTPAGESVPEARFQSLLGHVSDELYRNVFAISLQELQAAKQLQGEELRNFIYGAGLGLGQRSIPDVKKAFSDVAERLYKPRGSAQVMNNLASELLSLEKQIRGRAGELGQYDTKKRERDTLSAEVTQLSERQRALQVEQRSLSNQRSLYETFVRMRAANAELAQLEGTADVPEASVEKLKKHQQSIASLEERLKEAQVQRATKQTETAALAFDPALLEREDNIKSLSRSLTQYRDAQRDLPVLEREQELAREQIRRDISGLGDRWNEERVRTFVLTAEQRDALNRTGEALRAQERAVEKANDRLEDYRNQSRASRARPSLPLTYRLIGLAILALGAAGCAYSAINGYTIPAIVSGIAAALGLVIALSLGSSSGPLRDRTLEELATAVDEAAQRLTTAQADWHTHLETLGLTALSPDAVNSQLHSLKSLQETLRSIDGDQVRVDRMRTVIGETATGLAQVTASLAEPLGTADVAAGIEALDARLDKAQEYRAERERIARDIQALESTMASLNTGLTEERRQVTALLSSFGVTTAEEFIALSQRSARMRSLREDVRRDTIAMQASVGIGAAYDSFVSALQSTNPEEIMARIAAVDDQLSTLSAGLEAANQRVGGLDAELSALTSGEALLEMESRAEVLKQHLSEAYREWLRAQLALWTIDKAISKYETTRQPAVIRAAQSAFVMMTGGKYDTLLSPLGSDDLRVRDAEGRDRGVDELSRGTREQLYLAMRLGLIDQYEQNSEPLPVIMDDILVNFDDDRGPLAVQALAGFAKDRQVIVMTCHESTRRMYLDAGAVELRLERDASAT